MIGVFRASFPAGRRSGCDEEIEFFGRAEGVYTEAGDDGGSAAEICRIAGMSHATYFHLRKKYAELLPDEMRPLKAQEDENSILRKPSPT